MNEPLTNDVAIIGAGPVGLFCVFALGLLKIKAVVIDALSTIGGQCIALYPEKPIYDVPAIPEITAQSLIEQLKIQAERFSPHYLLGQQVTSLEKNDAGHFILQTDKGNKIIVKAVIIAAGVGSFAPNRPPIANIKTYEGKSVFYLVQSRDDFIGKRVVIAGGGDSAIDWSIALADIAEKVTLIHRRNKFRAAPATLEKLESYIELGRIELVAPYQLVRIEGENGQLSAVIVATLEGQERSLPADILLPFYGLAYELGPIADWGLNLDRSRITIEQSTSQSNIAGIFAVGDIAHYDNKLKLILTGFAEATQAAHAAYKFVFPGLALHFEHSTTSMQTK